MRSGLASYTNSTLHVRAAAHGRRVRLRGVCEAGSSDIGVRTGGLSEADGSPQCGGPAAPQDA